jgi:hypothetical protein
MPRILLNRPARAWAPGVATCALAFALVLGPEPVEGQRVRAFYVTSSSDVIEVDDASGLGIMAGFMTPFGVEGRLGVRRVSDSHSRPDFLCVSYDPNTSCLDGVVDTETTLTHISGGFGFPVEIVPMLMVTPAAEIALTQVGWDARSETGREPNAFHPNSAQFGWTTSLELAVRPVPSVPLSIAVAADRRWIRYNGCSTETEGVYAPFCGTEAVTEFEIGAQFQVR